MGIADDLGLIDEAFGPETVEDEADALEVDSNPLEMLSKEQLVRLVDLFFAIPEEERAPIEAQLREELPPQIASRLDAIIRFVRGQASQTEGV